MILRLSFYGSSKIVENFFKKKSLKNLQNEKTRIIFVVANEGREKDLSCQFELLYMFL